MITLELLQVCLYLVFGVAVTCYAILDGFDLGTGMLHLFVKKDQDRRIFLNAIGPVWDGNAVWLVIVMGVLFAGFPPVFATLFTGFYIMCMLLIFGLMLRAVAIEFRSKQESPLWRKFWDHTFSYSSYIIAFGVGTMFGNLIEGVPLDAQGNFLADLSMTFRPYPVLVGFLAMSLFSMHGAIYLCMKTEGKLHDTLRNWVSRLVLYFGAMFAITTWATLHFMPRMLDRLTSMPVLFIFPIGAFIALTYVSKLFKKGKDLAAFLASSAAIACLFVTFGLGTFPILIHSTMDPSYSLTIFNSSSSFLTLGVLMLIVLVGVPLVFVYGSAVYRIFKGKVTLNKSSY